MKMLNSYVLIEEIKTEISAGGILMPTTLNERMRKARVEMSSTDLLNKDDIILYDSFSVDGETTTLDLGEGKESLKLQIIKVDQVIMITKESSCA